MNKKLMCITLLSLTILTTGCGSNQKANTNEEKVNSSIVENSNTNKELNLSKLKEEGQKQKLYYMSKEQLFTSATLTAEVKDIEDMSKQTDVAIEGVIISSEPYPFTNEDGTITPFTKFVVQVTEVLEGESNLVNQQIIVLEQGGLVKKGDIGIPDRFKDKPEIKDKELEEEVMVNLNGVPISLVGDEVALFLIKAPINSLGMQQEFYQILGNYLTRFDKNEETDIYERPDTDLDVDTEIIDPDLTKEELININEEVTEMIIENQ